MRDPYEIRQSKRVYPALRERIAEAGYTTAEIAALVGITTPTFSTKICGKQSWRQWEIEKFAVILGLTFEEIGRIFFYKRGQDQWTPEK